ncbi:uncharacterized protein LOC144642244 [Oculina patagonica]
MGIAPTSRWYWMQQKSGALPHVKLTKFATRTTPQGRYYFCDVTFKAHALVDRFKFRRFGYGLRTVRICKDGKAQERQLTLKLTDSTLENRTPRKKCFNWPYHGFLRHLDSSAKIRVVMSSQKTWPQVMLIRQPIPRIIELFRATSRSNKMRPLQ